jgi:glycosyltransferase involved in cell wall biosynthesis
MLFTSGDHGGCGLYRTRYPAEMLNKEWNFGFKLSDSRLNNSSVIQLQRATNEMFLKIIPMLKAQGKKIIYDIDDNLWEIPSYNPAYRPYNSSVLKTTKRIMGLCDVITVSTEPLRDYFLRENFHKDIVIIPNFLHDLPEYSNNNISDNIKIFYHGTTTHAGDFDSKLVFALREILSKNENVEFICVGYNPLKDNANKKIKFIPYVPIEEFHKTIQALKCDIGIATLKENLFNQCKSSIKVLEYASCSIPTIASDVYPYSNCISHMENGILIKKEKEWIGALKLLIEDHNLRLTLGKNIHTYVNKNFTYKNNGQKIRNIYNTILENIL